MTNAERIRAMSDEELVKWITKHCPGCDCCSRKEKEEPCVPAMCSQGVLEWLRQDAE